MNSESSPPGGQPQPPDRTRRTVILATAGIVVILVLALFAAVFAAPFLHTRAVLAECRIYGVLHDTTNFPVLAYDDGPVDAQQHAAIVLEKLGGPARALARLRSYWRAPEWIAPHKDQAVHLLGRCGAKAVPILIAALSPPDSNSQKQWVAAWALAEDGPAARDAIPALESVASQNEKGSHTWQAARIALGRIRFPPQPPSPAP